MASLIGAFDDCLIIPWWALRILEKAEISKEFGSKLNFAAKLAKFDGSGTGRQFCCCWKNIWKVFEKILAEYLKTIWNTGRQFYCCCGGEKISFFKFFILVFNSTAAAVKYHQKYSKHATAPWFEGVDDGHGWSIWYVGKTIE